VLILLLPYLQIVLILSWSAVAVAIIIVLSSAVHTAPQTVSTIIFTVYHTYPSTMLSQK